MSCFYMQVCLLSSYTCTLNHVYVHVSVYNYVFAGVIRRGVGFTPLKLEHICTA